MITLLSWPHEASVCLADPRLGVTSDGVGVVDLLGLPGVVGGVGQHGDGPVTGPAHQDQTLVVGRPLDTVDTAVMVYILVDLSPLVASFLPNNDSPVIRARCQNVSKLGMSPSDLPHWPLVTSEVGGQSLGPITDIEYLD